MRLDFVKRIGGMGLELALGVLLLGIVFAAWNATDSRSSQRRSTQAGSKNSCGACAFLPRDTRGVSAPHLILSNSFRVFPQCGYRRGSTKTLISCGESESRSNALAI